MVDTNKLRSVWVAKGLKQSDVAKMIKMPERTFSRKMKKAIFGSDEMEKLIDVLGIDEPCPIFFANSVTCKVTKSAAKR